LIPEGVKIYFGENMEKKINLEERIKENFKNNGYKLIELPSYEYYEDLKKNFSNSMRRKMFKFEDRETGEILTLRPDMTSLLAKLMNLKENEMKYPERIFYMGDVFRHEKMKERSQAGVELIGMENKYKSDLEILIMAIEVMKSLSLEKPKLEIGSIVIFNSLMEKLNIKKEDINKIKGYLDRKDIPTLEKLVKEKEYNEIILELPNMIGKKDILKKVENYVDIKGLKKVLNTLDELGYEENYILDLGMVKEMEYYTGIIFNGFAGEETGEYILTGGRYDKLMGVRALGFVLNIDTLVDMVEKTENKENEGYLIMGEDYIDGLKKKVEFVQQGIRAEWYSEKPKLEKVKEYAKLKKFKYILNIDVDEKYLVAGVDKNEG